VKQTIISRRQELLRRVENPDVSTLYTNDSESQFIQKATELIQQNIAESEYSSERLSSDLCMSYITAYRHIKSLTGMTPGEFIRNIRLKRAAQLLRSTDLPITEVAVTVGFSTPSYFTRSFQQEYGMSPSNYRKTKQQRE